MSRSRAVASAVFVLVGTLLASLIATGAARADSWVPNCSGNDYVSQVTVTPWPQGEFGVNITPTSNARTAYISGYGSEATNEIWHAVQDCVSGLYGELADSMYQQIECHVHLGISADGVEGIGGTGPTFDLESWRPSVQGVDDAFFAVTKCNWGGFPYGYDPSGDPSRPDGGVTDLDYSAIG